MGRPTGAALKTIWNLSLAPNASLDEQSVEDALAQRLAKNKLPTRVIFVEDLPRNAMGKVQKKFCARGLGIGLRAQLTYLSTFEKIYDKRHLVGK